MYKYLHYGKYQIILSLKSKIGGNPYYNPFQKLLVIALLFGALMATSSKAHPDSLNFEKFTGIEDELSFEQV